LRPRGRVAYAATLLITTEDAGGREAGAHSTTPTYTVRRDGPSDPDWSTASVVGSAGVGAALLHQGPHRLRVALQCSHPDWSLAILVGRAGVRAALPHQRPL
jgi:hypothetical protein